MVGFLIIRILMGEKMSFLKWFYKAPRPQVAFIFNKDGSFDLVLCGDIHAIVVDNRKDFDRITEVQTRVTEMDFETLIQHPAKRPVVVGLQNE